jgi:hypothetical protein
MFMFQSTGVDSLVLCRFLFVVPLNAVLDIDISEYRLPVDFAKLFDGDGGRKIPALSADPARVVPSNRYAPGTWNSVAKDMVAR